MEVKEIESIKAKEVINNEDSDEEKLDESEQKLWNKIDEILKEYHLSTF